MIDTILFVLYGVLLVILGLFTWRLAYAFSHFRMKQLMTTVELIDDLPTVTVCIPARNEMNVMTECLERVIASTYPKLEIIVLDDLSGDDTPTIVKSFAHEGVRFVEGSKLPDGWLGKNHALQGLYKEASGSYLLFMDVDTRIEPETIEQLVAYAKQENTQMVSVLPRRIDSWRMSIYFATLRYFWELIFHRKSSPATSSNAWLIEKAVLKNLGGFASMKAAIQPESKLSAQLMAQNKYRFLIGTDMLGISHQKKWGSQIATSIRLLYPLLGARPLPAAIAIGDLLILTLPAIIVVAGFWTGFTYHHLILGVILLGYCGLYAVYLRKVRKHGWLFGALLWPLITLQEAIVLIASVVKYQRRSVTWKGRHVTNKAFTSDYPRL